MNEEDHQTEELIQLDESQTELENNDQLQETVNKEIQQQDQSQSELPKKTDQPLTTEITDLIVQIKEDNQSPSKQKESSVVIEEKILKEPVTQTVKLTNIDQLSEETPRQSNSFYYLSGNFN